MAITWRVPVLVLIGLGAVVVRPAAATVWVWLAVVIALVLGDLALAPATRTLRVVRRPGGTVRQGTPTRSVLEVSNDGRRRVRAALRDAWPPSAGSVDNRHRVRLGPGDATTLTTTLLPVRRGDRRADRVTVRTLGPLGLAMRQRSTGVPGSVRVLPPFGSRRHLPSRLARLRELDGRAAVRVRGQGTEFDSLREYVRGDDVRSIDWRASARSRSVVVRTWQPERDRRVVLVLDTGRTSAGRVADVPRLDSAMDAALLLAALATRAGDRVDLVAGDRVVRARVLGRHRGTLATIDDALAGLEPVLAETSWRTLVGALDGLGRQRALVVLLTPVEPSAVEQGLLPLLAPLTARHRVLVASVRDPALAAIAAQRADARETYHAAAAEQALARRERTTRLLGALGVEVLDADADRLPVVLADHYLALKARGLL